MTEAIGWTLLHSLWQGAIVAAVLAAILLPLRSARLRYAAATFAMLALLAGFVITLVHLTPESGRRAAVPPLPVHFAPLPQAPDAPVGWQPEFAMLVSWLTPLWIGGVFIFYLRQAAGFIVIERMRLQGVCPAPAYWQRELARLSERMRLTRPVQLLESCIAESPIVLGHFRPLILMPAGLLTGLPAGQIEAILLHELAHVRRHDYLVNVIQRLVEGLLFYHPAAWWISSVIRAERENCCDDAVVAIRGDAHEYAQALSALEHNRQLISEPALAATGGSLVTRVRRLLYPAKSSGSWAPVLAAAILIATFTVTLAAWQATPEAQAGSATFAPDHPGEADGPYARWLNEDVVYIITDAERTAFQNLTTDAERNQFIQQFWLRRDPTPGTDQNEFKEEHYRRIAYANDRFRSSAQFGWKTDRGHMYIVYGPPDEIESHPRGDGARRPWEDWLFYKIDGVGTRVMMTFVDQNGNGEFRMTKDPNH